MHFIERNIRSRMTLFGITSDEMAACMRISKRTWFRKLQDPERKLTTGELKTIAKKLNCSFIELLEEI